MFDEPNTLWTPGTKRQIELVIDKKKVLQSHFVTFCDIFSLTLTGFVTGLDIKKQKFQQLMSISSLFWKC